MIDNDYLKAFIIGSSGLITMQHFIPLMLKDKSYYDYDYHAYSILAPLYYGIMTMIAFLIGNVFDLSFELRLFVISLISVIYIVSQNYLYSRKHYKPYKNFTTKDWIYYILTNGTRHLVSFNLIIYYLYKLFDYNDISKVFIIGSSAFSYIFMYLKVSLLDKENRVNYDYKIFTVIQPILSGLYLLLFYYFGRHIFKLNYKTILVLFVLLGSIYWYIGARLLQTYRHTEKQWNKLK